MWRNGGELEEPNSMPSAPSEGKQCRADAKVDIVAMLIERWELVTQLLAGSVRAMNLYSDASPATGFGITSLSARRHVRGLAPPSLDHAWADACLRARRYQEQDSVLS